MKTIGLIGGMSWESTSLYYQTINQIVAEKLGGLNSARMMLSSVNFEEVVVMQQAGQWEKMALLLADHARKLEIAGADCILICTNTMHKVAPQVQASIGIPLLHIADSVSNQILKTRKHKVGLLGTRFTMEQPFYTERLAKYGIDVVLPNEADRAEIHRIIFEELCQGKILDYSRHVLLHIADKLCELGAEGLILGCTELPLLVQQSHTAITLFDTTRLHAEAAADFSLAEESKRLEPAVGEFQA